ncbi:bacteriocin-like protein [Chryseobacterium sp.]|uniref:bacteriocin-like protein n=1 Tax=Chryseobacterium sp. TaxID=1871047 RepID=UPI0028A0B263|nr:hypothetical protein [Chryseobacterium sp.]
MKNLKKLTRKDLAIVSGGVIYPDQGCCGSCWQLDVLPYGAYCMPAGCRHFTAIMV